MRNSEGQANDEFVFVSNARVVPPFENESPRAGWNHRRNSLKISHLSPIPTSVSDIPPSPVDQRVVGQPFKRATTSTSSLPPEVIDLFPPPLKRLSRDFSSFEEPISIENTSRLNRPREHNYEYLNDLVNQNALEVLSRNQILPSHLTRSRSSSYVHMSPFNLHDTVKSDSSVSTDESSLNTMSSHNTMSSSDCPNQPRTSFLRYPSRSPFTSTHLLGLENLHKMSELDAPIQRFKKFPVSYREKNNVPPMQTNCFHSRNLIRQDSQSVPSSPYLGRHFMDSCSSPYAFDDRPIRKEGIYDNFHFPFMYYHSNCPTEMVSCDEMRQSRCYHESSYPLMRSQSYDHFQQSSPILARKKVDMMRERSNSAFSNENRPPLPKRNMRPCVDKKYVSDGCPFCSKDSIVENQDLCSSSHKQKTKVSAFYQVLKKWVKNW